MAENSENNILSSGLEDVGKLVEFTERKAKEAEAARILEEQRLEIEKERLKVEQKQLETLNMIERKIDVVLHSNRNITNLLPMMAKGDSEQMAKAMQKQTDELFDSLKSVGQTGINVGTQFQSDRDQHVDISGTVTS